MFPLYMTAEESLQVDVVLYTISRATEAVYITMIYSSFFYLFMTHENTKNIKVIKRNLFKLVKKKSHNLLAAMWLVFIE